MTARDSVCFDLYSGDVHEKLSKKTCLKCCEGGTVLTCNNGGCPIVLHESCIPCGARFGNDGEFLCPYCFYKQSHIECHQAKKKVLLARKALSSFLDLNMSMENGYMQNSRSLRGKKLDSSANNISSDSKAEIGEASHQSMQVDGGQQDDCSKVQTLGAEQQEAGSPTRSHYWAKGTVSKESENLNKISETVKMLQPSDNVSLGKEQTQAELQGTSIYLTKNANGQDMNEEPIKGSDDAFRYDFSVRSQMELTFRSAEHPAEIGDHCGRTEERKLQEKSPKNAPCHMMEDSLFVTLDKLGNFKDKEHATVVEDFNDRGAEKGPNQVLHEEISVCLAKENDKLEMHKESNQGDNSKFQDNSSVRSQVAVNSDAGKPAEVRDDHFKRTNEVQRQEILPEKDVHPMRVTVSVTHGESEAGDHSASSQHSCNTGTLQNANKDEESFETSQVGISEHEELEEVTNGTWRKITHSVKRSQRPTLPNMRRRKLLWTVEEVEMLKEGVQKFSSTVNKNMPWMKILDYGRHIFDGTRTPTDLKEKWKQLKRGR